ncbi:type VI secretion system baseplate subunit TssG [Agaribacter marinus]|uniref:Type VI secretion system protein ImpH n=1 Tax=Agaribacter marinus TaxID=1431249 RepID=A0AA37SXX3_9ALTE|nr:type VI secretion system baseplate subunit TssG [Agaribacter marinus]GLR71886.1 hypothetical protein GCM10007852_27940 [Agaribacter marinus]
MAHSNRLTKRYLEHLVSDQEELYKQGFTPLLRYLDANAPLAERIGYSVSPKQDALRFGQAPLLHFHSSAFTDVRFEDVNGNYKLRNSYWGLLGHNGPLPTHITEYAIERQYRIHDKTLTEFLDIFHHRFISLFYRAWADSQPAVCHDRPGADHFRQRLSVFYGQTDNPNGKEASLSFTDLNQVQQHLAGLFSQQNRSAGILSQILSEYLHQPVEIQEFEGEWYTLRNEEQSQLGYVNTRLGQDTILGNRTHQRSFNFSIIVGPLTYEEYISLIDDKSRMTNVKRLAIKHVGCEYSFSIKILLKPKQTRVTCLGKSRLGINTWCRGKLASNNQPTAAVVYQRVC